MFIKYVTDIEPVCNFYATTFYDIGAICMSNFPENRVISLLEVEVQTKLYIIYIDIVSILITKIFLANFNRYISCFMVDYI